MSGSVGRVADESAVWGCGLLLAQAGIVQARKEHLTVSATGAILKSSKITGPQTHLRHRHAQPLLQHLPRQASHLRVL